MSRGKVIGKQLYVTKPNRKLAKIIGRQMPVTKPNTVHKSPTDYDRRNNQYSIDNELFEMDGEEHMKDFTIAKKIAQDIYDNIIASGAHAARVTDSEPPVIEVYGITDEVYIITVDVK